MKQYGAPLARFAAGFEFDPVEREDLLQDICLAIWQALPRFRGECDEKTFLFRIAQNRGLSHRGRRGRRIRPISADPDRVADPAANPEQEVVDLDQHERLASAIGRLPEIHRTPVLLSLEGFSHREIAEVVGTSENNVAVRLSRARQRLRTLFDLEGSR